MPQATTDKTPEQIRADRKRQVALGYRLLASQRWGDLGDGHISARDPERTDCFWLLRYGVSYHAARVADLVLVGPDGELVEGEGFTNTAAYYIHHPILMAARRCPRPRRFRAGSGEPDCRRGRRATRARRSRVERSTARCSR